MNDNQQNEGVARFDIKAFLTETLRQRYIIAAVIAAMLLGSFLYTKLFCTPMYSTYAQMYIINSDLAQVNSSEVTYASYLVRDYTVFVTEREVLDTVRERLDLDISYQTLKGMVTAENINNTRLINVTAETDDPALSKELADTVCEVSQEKIVELMGVDRVNITSSAYLPTRPSSPDLRVNMLYGALIGIAISALFVVAVYYKNDKINGADDVQKYLGICTLATIPYNQSKGGRSYSRRRTVKTNGRA